MMKCPFCAEEILKTSEKCEFCDGVINIKPVLIEDRFELLTINGDEVVKDRKTGLMWQRNNGKGFTWNGAKSYAWDLKLGGFLDWRLPTIDELKTLITGVPRNSLAGSVYGGPGEKGFYWHKGVWKYEGDDEVCFWSSSECLSDYIDKDTGYAYNSLLVCFKNAREYNSEKGINYNVRCVR